MQTDAFTQQILIFNEIWSHGGRKQFLQMETAVWRSYWWKPYVLWKQLHALNKVPHREIILLMGF